MSNPVLIAVLVLLGGIVLLLFVVVSWVYHLAYAVTTIEAQLATQARRQSGGCSACWRCETQYVLPAIKAKK